MRSALLCLAICLLIAGSATSAPLLVADLQEYDFGEILQGTKVEYRFRFQNAGDQLLEIDQLRSSCGCTAALLSTRRLLPGEIGELRAVFDSQGFRGEVQKRISFNTNDPQHASVTFSLRGIIKSELYIEQERVNWKMAEPGQVLSSELAILNRSAQLVRLETPQVTAAGIRAELSGAEIAPGEQVFLRVTAEFPVDKKRLAGYVIINTDFSPVPQLKLPVSARLSR